MTLRTINSHYLRLAFAQRIFTLLVSVVFAATIASATTGMAATTKVPTKTITAPEEKAAEPKSDDTVIELPTQIIPNNQLPRIPEVQDDKSTTSKEPQKDSEPTAEETRNQSPPPPVMRDLSKLPAAVAKTRKAILDAAKSGDIEKLRPLIGTGPNATSLSIGGLEGDPIEFIKGNSGDEEGFEILAILSEVLEAGYVHLDAGKDDELYVWPYFFSWPFDKLTPEMRVELFRVLTAGDVEDSKNSGGYIFYRVGIKPDGSWSFFVAGD